MIIIRLAWRNLWRNKRRTLLTMSAMTVATAMVVFALAVYEGVFQDMIESATAYQGQIRVFAAGYYENSMVEMAVGDDGFRKILLSDPEVKGAAGRVRGHALLSLGDGKDSISRPVELLGIDPLEEHGVSGFEGRLTEGEFLSVSGGGEIVLGSGLARTLKIDVGDEVAMMAQDMFGSIAADTFRFTGIIDTGDPLRDISLVLVDRRTLQNFLALGDRLHEWAVFLDKPNRAESAAARIGRVRGDVEALPWNEFLPQINALIELARASRFIFALIFYFAVALVTANTLYMALMERLREFAVMNALGLRPVRIIIMVILEGFYMSCMAGAAGCAAGSACSFRLAHHPIEIGDIMTTIIYAESILQPRIRAFLTLEVAVTPVLMLVLCGLAVSLFPAWKLRKLRTPAVLREM